MGHVRVREVKVECFAVDELDRFGLVAECMEYCEEVPEEWQCLAHRKLVCYIGMVRGLYDPTVVRRWALSDA